MSSHSTWLCQIFSKYARGWMIELDMEGRQFNYSNALTQFSLSCAIRPCIVILLNTLAIKSYTGNKLLRKIEEHSLALIVLVRIIESFLPSIKRLSLIWMKPTSPKITGGMALTSGGDDSCDLQTRIRSSREKWFICPNYRLSCVRTSQTSTIWVDFLCEAFSMPWMSAIFLLSNAEDP